eukprot:Clim_evm121s134 gene=Clim_evmTU121s134
MAPTKKRSKPRNPKSFFDEEDLFGFFDANGWKRDHARRAYRHVVHLGWTLDRLGEIKDFPKRAAIALQEEFALTTSELVKSETSADGATTKCVVELQDGKMVECVIMRYGMEMQSFPEQEKDKMLERAMERSMMGSIAGDLQGENGSVSMDTVSMTTTGSLFKSNPRCTLCISSQVGCAMACGFCATGTMGLSGNLSSGEILEQLWHANQLERIRNIVFMGMGEPLDNYDNVLGAIRGITDVQRFSLSPQRVSLSTVGVAPRLRQLAKDMPGVSLALSLHAPSQELRTRIVPTAKAWHIDRIMEAMEEYVEANEAINRKRGKVMIEYCLIQGVNDSDETAHELGSLLRDRKVMLNVIPYNPTDVPEDFKPPTYEETSRFIDIVRNEPYNVHCLVRQELGQDISSACGQLVIKEQKQIDIEDMTGPNGPTQATERSNSKTQVRKRGRKTDLDVAAELGSTKLKDSGDAGHEETSLKRQLVRAVRLRSVLIGLVLLIFFRLALRFLSNSKGDRDV